MKHECILKDGNLIFIDVDKNRVTWQGKPGNYDVEKIIQIPGHEICIVLLKPDREKGRFQNLIGMNFNGLIFWKSELPDDVGEDVYVDVYLYNGTLIAHSWSGFRVSIDIRSGHIIGKEFTK